MSGKNIQVVIKGIRYTSTGSWVVEIAITDYRTMALNACDLIKVELTKPDDFIYPDTPSGTKIIAIRDTESLLGVGIPKGTVLTLATLRRRYIKNKYHGVLEGDDLNTKGYGGLAVPFEDFRIKVD